MTSNGPREDGEAIAIRDWADELLELDDEGRAAVLEQIRPYLTPSGYDILSCILVLEGEEDSVTNESPEMAWARRLLSLSEEEDPADVLKQLDSHLTPYDKGVIVGILEQIEANDDRENTDTTNILLNIATFGAPLGVRFIRDEEEDDNDDEGRR